MDNDTPVSALRRYAEESVENVYELSEAEIYKLIKNLRVGQSLKLPERGYVKKKSAMDYVLADNKNVSRTRWGHAKEILPDVMYFLENGKLPPTSNGIW